MRVLSGLEPKPVFRFFEEICRIPHGSHNTRAISEYLVRFARERGLRWRRDEANNVIIWKDASPGYEKAPTVMIQGHTDMVCEKEPDCARDMEREGLELFVEGDTVGARGTTLGGDDGIAVAIALAVLDDDSIPHGPLECLFTVDEEVGMLGARALDASDLKASCLMNIDSEAEGVLTVSCAGSTRAVCTLPISREAFSGTTLRLRVGGLLGGHSGEEIHKGRANANILLGRSLRRIELATGTRLIRVRGGSKDNAIPRQAEALLAAEDPEAARAAAAALQELLRGEFRVTDPEVTLLLEEAEAESGELPLTAESSRRVISFLFCAPNGVQVMSPEVPGLVQTSLNLGQACTEEESFTARFMVRSSVNSQKDETTEKVAALTEVLGGSVQIPAAYSAWEYRADSPLRDTMIEAFRAVYGREPKIEALHAGLECGILSGKMPWLDCISFGPDLSDIHTPAERLHIASTRRVWELTLETLRRLR